MPIFRKATERHKRLEDYWSDSLHDMRYAFRTLGRSPGFATASIVILSLAIGADVAVVALVSGYIPTRRAFGIEPMTALRVQ